MERAKTTWRKTPHKIRKPITLVVGLVFIVAAGATGWLPGPGGIPLFLIGVAVLATEFAWADRLKQHILHIIRTCGSWLKIHRVWAAIILIACTSFSLFSLFALLRNVL